MVAEVAQVNDEVLDVRETAMLLGLPEEVVIDEAAKGNLPGRQIGGQWRFSHARVLAWLRADAGTDDTQARSRPPGRGRQDVDRLLAAQPAEPPTPAEQAARDDNDALGEP
jgi:excisionase family DNA binding protein